MPGEHHTGCCAIRAVPAYLFFVTVAGCASGALPGGFMDTRPDDFDVLYEWREGSLPPPYHYEYQIHVAASGSAEITLIPDYPANDVPNWTETFTIPPDHLDALYRRLLQLGLLSTAWRTDAHAPTGGSSESMTVRAHGQQIELPVFIEPVHAARASEMYSALRALVPQALWDKLKLQLQKRMQKQQQ
jgi:hypothetical protein